MNHTSDFARTIRTARKRIYSSACNAARNVNTCEKKLLEYETGQDCPPTDIAYRMGMVFEDSRIHREYCNSVCPIGKRYPRQAEVIPLPQVACSIHSELQHISKVLNRLMDIAADGMVGMDEDRDFQEIVNESRAMRERLEQLELWAEVELMTKEKPVLAKPA
jgi:predicted transcriptional regulator